jgi:hypothetical protein
MAASVSCMQLASCILRRMTSKCGEVPDLRVMNRMGCAVSQFYQITDWTQFCILHMTKWRINMVLFLAASYTCIPASAAKTVTVLRHNLHVSVHMLQQEAAVAITVAIYPGPCSFF